MSSVPTGGNVWKNVIIGILTTVAAYVIIHFIFDKGGKKEEFNKRKEATTGVWKTILKSNGFFLDDFYGAFCRKKDKEIIDAMSKAIDKQVSDYELLQKKQDMDEDMGLFINRFLDRSKDIKKTLQEYFEAAFKIENDNSLSEKSKKIKSEETDSIYLPQINELQNQDSGKINTLYRELVARYGNNFPPPAQKPDVTADFIKGKWREGVNKFFEFRNDKTMTMTVDDKSYPGKWSLSGNVLTFDFEENSTINYNIFYYGQQFFRFKLDSSDNERQLCRQ